ncbi:NifU family protein [Actinomadura sp. 9N407]|uniref:NifU family protein n=1 Tax=Actinomadura sp. 9N407 TaxID=3375154 RepID=UPI00378CAC48
MESLREVEARVERLVEELSDPPPVRHRAEELVRLLMHLYGEGLGRVVGLLAPDQVARLASDDLVGSLLILHDLHPDSTLERVGTALERIRPHLGSHAGGVELIGIEDGVVHLRLRGACDGCPSSASTVRDAIETAVRAAAPEITAIEVENATPEPSLLQIGTRPPLTCPAPLRPGATT